MMTESALENLCDLLFEVSNEDRLSILKKLLQEEMNISRISRVLSLSAQETSRHITRLFFISLVGRFTTEISKSNR
jgi:DNA-binding transcriptional ArsR family regulator